MLMLLNMRSLLFLLYLFDLLLDVIENRAIEKLTERDIYSVAQLLYRNDAGILTFGVQHTVYG